MFYEFRRRLRRLKNLHAKETRETFKLMKRGRWKEANDSFHKQYTTKRALERILRLKK